MVGFWVITVLSVVSSLAMPLAQAQARPYGPGTSSAAGHMASAAAISCESRSPKHTVALVELFTSEGCSSCPPADRWLQTLPASADGFDRVVPLSLHVGYWDYIGWKDPYAQKAFTERQREYARLRGTTTIYTPQVVLSGKDFPAWSGAGFAREVKANGEKPAAASLQLSAAAVGTAVQIKTVAALNASAVSTPAQLHLAVFEMGLRNKVLRGENRGETLTHDFVVRQWHGPFALSQGQLNSKEQLTLEASSSGRQLGVAAFVQTAKGEVLQASACIMQ